jgi:LysM repeat protein
MKYLVALGFFLIFVSGGLYAQSDKYIQHKVAKRETIAQIAIKYNVTESAIYELNPDAQKGIKKNTILLIPNIAAISTSPEKSNLDVNSSTRKHEVLAKETFYGISKQYNVSIEDIQKANVEVLKDGIKPGQILLIPVKDAVSKKETKAVVTNKPPVFHEVKPKETKYAIAKQYGVTIEQLEKLNPEIVSNLPIGYKLLISGEIPKINKPETVILKPESVVLAPESVVNYEMYTVNPKETIYSISNQFNITEEELLVLNPELKLGLLEGMILKVPAKKQGIFVGEIPKRDYKDLSRTFRKGANKNLAILLPFNITKLDNDTINSIETRLKKDKFLNLTLDFYAGALIAIDSVKKMGGNVDISILDSNETKSSSNVASLIQGNNLKRMDAIIGPFYQYNVEKMIELLGSDQIPVISPLSKEYNKSYANLIQATPSTNYVKNAMFEYMRANNGNIVAVVDPKKGSAKQYILENQKDAVFAEFSETGNLNLESLKALLVKDKVNFVIMETENTNLILSLTNALLKYMADYQIRLVILGENEALDYEEIAMSRLTKLRLLYPSQTRVNDLPEATIFENTFKKKNKVFPNQFATRGFDVTFDILMRLSQENAFIETLNEAATEQVENKFYYTPKLEGGYTNRGVYILYYDTDLTIKEAK